MRITLFPTPTLLCLLLFIYKTSTESLSYVTCVGIRVNKHEIGIVTRNDITIVTTSLDTSIESIADIYYTVLNVCLLSPSVF